MQTRLCLVFLAMLASLVSLCGPAPALIGDAGPADIAIQRNTILVYSAKGRCTGVVLASDLILTAAHCVEWPDTTYLIGGIVGINQFTGIGVAEIVHHPDFRKIKSPNADLALVKLATHLSERFTPAFLQARPVQVGDRVIVGGYGVAVAGQPEAYATLRSAAFVVSRRSLGGIRVVDLNREDSGRSGPCNGDSGAPAFTYSGLFALVGIMSASNCKGTASLVAVSHYYDWIIATASKLGSPLK
jgi:secreted trypsin-like serine protease